MKAWVASVSNGLVTAVLTDVTAGNAGAVRSLSLRTGIFFLLVTDPLQTTVSRAIPILNPYF